MKNQRKKGFTIVELVIVIAVIAVLAAVLIPTFANLINKANVASDTALVKNLNTILISSEATDGKNVTMTDALKDAASAGYTVEKLTPTSTGDILWDEENDQFVLINADQTIFSAKEVTDKKYKLWKIVDEIPAAGEEKGYSYYLSDDFSGTDVTVSSGLDVGNHTDIATVTYTNETESKEVVIRTNSFDTDIIINAPLDSIYHYGNVRIVYGKVVQDHSYYEFGQYKLREETKGHFVDMVNQSVSSLRYIVSELAIYDVNNNVLPVPAYVAPSVDISVLQGTGNINSLLTKTEAISDETKIINGIKYFAGGMGVESSPYLLDSFDQIKRMNDYSGYFKMISNITLSEELYLRGGKSWNLDLNGFTLDLIYSSDAKRSNRTTIYLIGSKSKLTIDDTSLNKSGKILGAESSDFAPDNSVIRVANFANLTINGGYFYSRGNSASCIFVYTSMAGSTAAVVNIYGGIFETKSPSNNVYFVLNHEDGMTTGCKITVYGGTFINYCPGVTAVDPDNARTGKIVLGEGCTILEEKSERGMKYIVSRTNE